MQYRRTVLLALVVMASVPILLNTLVLSWLAREREPAQKYSLISRQVQQVSSTVDLLVDKIMSDFVILSYREPFTDLAGWLETADYRQKIKLFSDFDPVSILSVYYQKAYLLYPAEDLVVDLKNKFISPLSSSVGGKEAFGRVSRELSPSNPAPSGGLPEGGVYLTRTLPVPERNTTYYLYIELGKNFFASILGDIFLLDQSSIAVLDRDGRVLVSFSRGTEVDPAAPAPGNLASTIGSPKRGWQYRYVIDQAAISRDIWFSMLQYSLLAILLVIISGLLSTRLLRVITGPVMELMSLLGNDGDEGPELKNLQSNIRLLINRNQELVRSLSSHESLERDQLLTRLLKGTLDTVPEPADLESHQLHFMTGPGVRYRAAACLVRPGTRIPVSRDLPPGLMVEWLEVDDRHLALLMSHGPELPRDALMALLEGLCTPGGADYLGLGTEKDNLAGLSESWHQALIALDHRGQSLDQPVIHYQEALERAGGYFYPFELEARLVSLIKQLDMDGVHDVLGQFFSSVRLSGVKFQAANHMYHHLLDTLVRIVKDYDLPWEGFPMGGPDNIWNLLDRAVGVREMEVLITGLVGTLLSRLGSTKDSPTVVLANTVKDYVDEHYADPLLSLDLISDQLKYSISHLSTVFKDTFGETIKDYITGLRLGKAQELLAKTDTLILEVGLQVGYQNFGSFVKIFKAYLGETPKAYRMRMRGK